MKFMGMLVVLAAVGLAGCAADVDGDESDDSDVSDMESPSLSEEAFVMNATNYACGKIPFRTDPNGTMRGWLSAGTPFYATSTITAAGGKNWVFGKPQSGAFKGIYDWVWVNNLNQDCK